MFLTRSKTSSAISEEQQYHLSKDNMLPLIPDDMIPVLEKASPAIDSALNSILPENAKDLTMNMVSAWIISSRIAANNNSKTVKNVSKLSPKPTSKPFILRSWTSRSFLVKPKASVAPLQTRGTQISEKPTIDYDLSLHQDRTPSLTASSTFTASSLSTNKEQEEGSLLTPLLQDADKERRLPVSLKSMIDLLDTPPLIPDQSSLSLIEETLTPMSSSFLEDHGHIVDSPSSEASATIAENTEHTNAVTPAPNMNPKSMRNSISSMISSLGLSMKKAFKLKPSQSSSIVQLKKSLSIQRHLSTSKGHQKASISRVSTPSLNRLNTSFSTKEEEDLMPNDKKQDSFSPCDRPEAKAYAAAFATFISTGKVDNELADVYGGNKYSRCASELSLTTENLEDQDGMPFTPLDNVSEEKPSVYWDGDDTQSQQFDKLLDDIWERSQEYQEYFASEAEANSEHHKLQDNYSFLNFSETPSLWSPPPATADSNKHRTVKASRTEGNMNGKQDSIPYVCVGNQRSSLVKVSPTLKKLVNIEDLKAYKRSTSAYSNIKDYDINWQESFHEEKKSREKVAKTLKSVSWAFYCMIKRNHKRNEFECDIVFDENESSVSDTSLYNNYLEPLTDWNDIYDQLAYVFDCGELTSEHAIITYIYVKRMLDMSNQRLWDFSWRMITMSSLLTAVKVWDDCAIFNADFAMIFPELTLDVINNIERVFLTYLEWDVSVNCSDFARTYFHLRDIEHMMEQW